MGRYEERVLLYGNTERDRAIMTTKNDLKRRLPSNPSYKNVLINGIETNLVIDSNTLPTVKEIKTMPEDKVYMGDIVDWLDSKWMILSLDLDDELYQDGTMKLCDTTFKWQNKEGKIIEREVCQSSDSSYNNGVTGNNEMSLGQGQMKFFVPYDNETVKLKRGKRFFIDNDKEDPMVYVITKYDNFSNVYNGHGYIILTLTEDQFNKDTDNIELYICNYTDHSKDNVVDTSTSTLNRIEIRKSQDGIRLNYKNGTTLYPELYIDGIANKDIKLIAEVFSENAEKIKVLFNDDNSLNLSCYDKELLGETVVVTFTCKEYEVTESVVLKVVSLIG